jgi:hypothetical protein
MGTSDYSEYERRLRRAMFWEGFWRWGPLVAGVLLAFAICLWALMEF